MDRSRSPSSTRSSLSKMMDHPAVAKCPSCGVKLAKEVTTSAIVTCQVSKMMLKDRLASNSPRRISKGVMAMIAAKARAEAGYSRSDTHHPGHLFGQILSMRTLVNDPTKASHEEPAIRQPCMTNSGPQRPAIIKSPVQVSKLEMAAQICEDITAAKELKKVD